MIQIRRDLQLQTTAVLYRYLSSSSPHKHFNTAAKNIMEVPAVTPKLPPWASDGEKEKEEYRGRYRTRAESAAVRLHLQVCFKSHQGNSQHVLQPRNNQWRWTQLPIHSFAFNKNTSTQTHAHRHLLVRKGQAEGD